VGHHPGDERLSNRDTQRAGVLAFLILFRFHCAPPL